MDSPRSGDATLISGLRVLTDAVIIVLMEGGAKEDLKQGYKMMSDKEREKLHYPFEDTREHLERFKSEVDGSGPQAWAQAVTHVFDVAWVKMRSFLAGETAGLALG